MSYDGPERRGTDNMLDTGERRRVSDLEMRKEDFRLFRDKVLLAIGAVIVLGVCIAAVFTDVRNESLALAALTVGAGLLGAPTFLRLDENRGRRAG